MVQSLHRFEFTVLKDKSPSDKAQVPTSGTITFCPPGPVSRATFNFTQILPDSAAIRVDLRGEVREGDELGVVHGTALSTHHLTVDTIEMDSDLVGATLYVFNDGAISGVPGDRLVILNRPLTCYPDLEALGTGTPCANADSSTGRVGVYLREPRFDFIVSIIGLPPRAYVDRDRSDPTRVNAMDFATFQDAINCTPVGGVLTVPAGVYRAPSLQGFVITQPITIQGVGPSSTLFGPFEDSRDGTVFRIAGPVRDVTLKDLGIWNLVGDPGQDGQGDGIIVETAASTGGYVAHCSFDNLSIRYMGRDGIRSIGSDTSSHCFDQSVLHRLEVSGCRGHGIHLEFGVDLHLSDVSTFGNRLCGMHFKDSGGLHLSHCLFNGNGTGFPMADWPWWDDAQLYLVTVLRSTIQGCDFEVFTNVVGKRAIGLLNCQGLTILGCGMFNESYVAGSDFITLLDSNSGCLIAGNQASSVEFFINALSGHRNEGNVILPPSVTSYSTVNQAPAKTSVPNQPSSTTDRTGGNVVFVPLRTGVDYDQPNGDLCRFIGAIQLPIVDGVTQFDAPVQAGTILYDGSLQALRYYDGTTWRTLQSS